jgi:1-acyl-sn-glycerol-3-phosphate acyltransferase
VLYALAWNTVVPLARRRIRRVTGLEHVPETGPYILAANHISWLDPAYLMAALGRARGWRVHFVSKSTKHRWAGTLPINPDNRNGVIPAATAILERGGAVGIFPEGFSNPEATMPQGKTGAARLALATGVPVVPVGILGKPQPSWWRSVMHLLFPLNIVRAILQRKTYDVVFGEPIVVARQPELPTDEVRRRTDELMRALAHLCGKRYIPT